MDRCHDGSAPHRQGAITNMMLRGRRVVDANRPLVIYVHKNDVALGQIKNCEECAIAIAIKRQLRVRQVIVLLSIAYIFRKGRWERYAMPLDAREQLRR